MEYIIESDVLVDVNGSEERYVVPDGVKKIGDDAFNSSEAKEIILPDSVEEIGENAFIGSNIESIVLPKSLKKIGDSAFCLCNELKSIELPGSVKEIPTSCFSNCHKLEEVKFHKGLQMIKDSAFNGCDSLKELKFPHGLLEIEGTGTRIERVFLPSSIVKMDEYAFNYPGTITEYCVEENSYVYRILKAIAEYDEDYVLSIVPPETFADADDNQDDNPDDNPQNKDPFIRNGNILLTWADTSMSKIAIPDDIEEINRHAFSECNKMEWIVIPKSTKIIREYAFVACENLRYVVILSDTVNIEHYAFGAQFGDFCIFCFPDSTAEQYAVKNEFDYALIPDDFEVTVDTDINDLCSRSMFVPINKISNLDESGWINLASTTEVFSNIAMPHFIDELKPGAFKHQSMRSIDLSKTKITEIPDSVFESCSHLVEVKLPAGVTVIGEKAFSDCYALTGIDLPEEVIEIKYGAFHNCSKLLYVGIPDSAILLDDAVFNGLYHFVLLCNQGSFAQKYATRKHIPWQPRNSQVIYDLNYCSSLRERNDAAPEHFEIAGMKLSFPQNMSVYCDTVFYYAGKAESIYYSYLDSFNNIFHKDSVGDLSLESSVGLKFLEVLEDAASDTENVMKKYGIFRADAHDMLYKLNPALPGILDLVDITFKFIKQIAEEATNTISYEGDRIISEAERKITGLSYGVITNSAMVWVGYAFDNYFARVRQRKAASAQAVAGVNDLRNKITENVSSQYKTFMNEQIFPAMKNAIYNYVDGLFNSHVRYFSSQDILPEDISKQFNYQESTNYLTKDIMSSPQKETAVAKAISICPYNLSIYDYANINDPEMAKLIDFLGMKERIISAKND